MEKKPYMILVASQKGGVGKTAFALNLSAALMGRGFKVLLVDADACTASASEQLKIGAGQKGYDDVLRGRANFGSIFTYEPVNLDILPAEPAGDALANAPDGDYQRLYSKLSRLDYDFVVVDSAPGNLFNGEAVKFFNDVAILSTPDYVSVVAGAKTAAYCDRLKVQHRLIVNKVGKNKADLGIDVVEKLYGDIVFEILPEDAAVPASMRAHKPVYVLDSHAPFVQAVEKMAKVYSLRVGGRKGAEEGEQRKGGIMGKLEEEAETKNMTPKVRGEEKAEEMPPTIKPKRIQKRGAARKRA